MIDAVSVFGVDLFSVSLVLVVVSFSDAVVVYNVVAAVQLFSVVLITLLAYLTIWSRH